MTAEEMENRCRNFVQLNCIDKDKALNLLNKKYARVEIEEEKILVYDEEEPEKIVDYLYKNGVVINEIKKNKIGLEEYYLDLMKTQSKGGK